MDGVERLYTFKCHKGFEALQQHTSFFLTLYAQLKAHMAEGKCSCFRLQLTDAADVVIVQVYVYKVLLFFHAGSNKKKQNKKQKVTLVYKLFTLKLFLKTWVFKENNKASMNIVCNLDNDI